MALSTSTAADVVGDALALDNGLRRTAVDDRRNRDLDITGTTPRAAQASERGL